MISRVRITSSVLFLLAVLSLVGVEECERPFFMALESPATENRVTEPGEVSFVANLGTHSQNQIVSVELFRVYGNEFEHVADLTSSSLGRFSYDWNVTSADNGAHMFVVEATDQLGRPYYSGLIKVSVDIDGGCSFADGDLCILEDVNDALAAWKIGMPNANVSATRTEGNPKNWISVGCDGPGLDPSDRADCREDFGSGSNTIGTCSYWYSSSRGEILQTQILLRESYLAGSSSDADKLSVIIHEIGHCIGLKHWPTRDHVMYGSTSGADLPAPGELAAVAEAYAPPRSPSSQTADAYFNVGGGRALRQLENPQFTLDATFAGGTASFFQVLPAPGEPLPPDAVRVKHEFNATGHCSY